MHVFCKITKFYELSDKYICLSKLMKRARSDGSILRKSNASMSSNGRNGVLKSSFIDSKSELQSPNSSSDAINEISSAPDNTVTVSKSRLVSVLQNQTQSCPYSANR